MRPFRERFHVRLVRGDLKGLLPGLLRLSLAPPSWLFAAAAEARVALYRMGIFTRHRMPCPVVSVGNLTVGGTGKTPLVEWVVCELRLLGFQPTVLTRGYGAQADEMPDEVALLRENLPDFRHVRDPDRVRGALTAIEDHRADSLVLDDGFQHHRIARDLDLVTVDCLNPFGGGHCLPRGTLREPLRALRRASVVILTRADQVGESRLEKLRSRLRRFSPRADLATAVHDPVGLLPLGEGERLSPLWVAGRRIYAVSGVGNPEAFERTLASLGAIVVDRARFADHRSYDESLLNEIARAAGRAEADAVVTTQKDAVKWPAGLPDGPPALALVVRFSFRTGERAVRERLRRALRGPRGAV